MQEPYEQGVANHSAPSFAVNTARCALKRKQGNRWAGYRASACPVKEERLMCSVGGKPIEEKVRNLVAWIGEKRETKSFKSIDKVILRVVSKSSGRNDRKRRVASKNSRPKGRILRSWMKAAWYVAD
jgi:hypothetical protein